MVCAELSPSCKTPLQTSVGESVFGGGLEHTMLSVPPIATGPRRRLLATATAKLTYSNASKEKYTRRCMVHPESGAEP